MIGFPLRFVNHFLSNISRIMRRSGVPIGRKYSHVFGGCHPVVISSFYSTVEFPKDLVEQLVDISLYPDNKIARLVEADAVTAREANFINAAIEFIHQFIRFKDANLALLRERLVGAEDLREIIKGVQRRADKDNYPFEMIIEAFAERPDVIKALCRVFTSRFAPSRGGASCDPAAALAAYEAVLRAMPMGAADSEIFRWGLAFVDSILRTNFFLPVKSALAFRLKREFLEGSDYEAVPYGVFMIKGRNFFGFHTRFKDIARGGIRIVRASTVDDSQMNADHAFEECYNLAFTQNKKNKDIPEGGSKGIIILAPGASPADSTRAFMRYVDALLDLLLPSSRSYIAGFEEEILFLGPDEGTADLMDLACERARMRGYRYWKCFTTGKSARLGGVSHIDYGMTTNGVRQYVKGILRKLGIKEESVTKAQTGGPDGDLGGNEILMSKERTLVVIDGGGVIYDPDGLDRKELRRLARRRLDSSQFDSAAIGPRGFKVRASDRDVKLPDGTLVASGLSFRNSFHLDPRMRADLFVPCGGRPKSINGTNWKSLLDAEGRPLFKWIVEGANLFITQDARLKLEEKGVILFKDSSTNKGGVTSSSLEVLAGLALDDVEFENDMAVAKGAKPPRFRERYIEEIVEVVRAKSDAEFETLWQLRESEQRPISELSDGLSEKINEITTAVESSDLFADRPLRQAVLCAHFPKSLVEKVGMPALEKRIPLNYQKAIFARMIASGFVYRYGLRAGFEDYRRHIESIR